MALEAQQRDRDEHGPAEISPRPRGRGGSWWTANDQRSAQADDSPRARAPAAPARDLASGASWKCRRNAKSIRSRIVRAGMSPATGLCGGTRLGS